MKRSKIQNESVFTLESEVYEASVIPQRANELQRVVKIFSDVDLKGGIFAHQIEMTANDIFVRKAVYASDSISIGPENKSGEVWLNSIVSAKNSILGNPGPDGKIRFSNSVQADKINLKNAIVYGNLFGKEIILENSIVLGGVYCDHQFEASNSIVGTLHANFFKQTANMGLISNFAQMEHQPRISHKLFSLNLIAYNGTQQNTIYQIANREIFPYYDEQTDTHSYVVSPSLRIFDVRAYEQTLTDNFRKVAALANMEVSDYKKAKEEFKAVEVPLFYLINQEFKVDISLPRAGFMEIPADVLDDQQGALFPGEPEKQREDAYGEEPPPLPGEKNEEEDELDEDDEEEEIKDELGKDEVDDEDDYLENEEDEEDEE